MRNIFLFCLVLFFAVCSSENLAAQAGGTKQKEVSTMKVKITVGTRVISAVLYDNEAAKKIMGYDAVDA